MYGRNVYQRRTVPTRLFAFSFPPIGDNRLSRHPFYSIREDDSARARVPANISKYMYIDIYIYYVCMYIRVPM